MQSDSNRKSLNLSNNFSSLYLRLDNFPKNYAKVIVLFCPPEIYRELTVCRIFFEVGLNFAVCVLNSKFNYIFTKMYLFGLKSL